MVCFGAHSAAFAQTPPTSTLRVTVTDPSGAVIVGAQVHVTDPSGAVQTRPTGVQGEAIFEALVSGRYTIAAESPGSSAASSETFACRGRETRRELRLAIQRVAEDLRRRTRSARARDRSARRFVCDGADAGADRRAARDPDEMEHALRELAGPGAVMRVNGFRGGRLPPKSQIQSIRFRRNIFAADTHEAGFVIGRHLHEAGRDELAIDDWTSASGTMR